MREFPKASALPKIYTIEGIIGQWKQISYSEARFEPSAVRAMKNKVVAWFILVHEETEEDSVN